MRVLDFEAHALAVGVWAGSTYSGAELDTVVPLPPAATGMPTTSQLLAAYVATADSTRRRPVARADGRPGPAQPRPPARFLLSC